MMTIVPKVKMEDDKGAAMVPIIEMKNISKNFGGVAALQNVNLTLYEGEVLGLVGDNGAGKSTLIKILSGAIVPDSGEIYFRAQNVQINQPKDAKKLGIETIYQDLALIDNLHVPANVFIGREIRKGFLGRIFRIMDLKQMECETKELLSRLRISIESLRERVGSLSGGQRQSVAIGRAIYFDAKVLIMDEPTAALGVEETEKVHNLIRDLKNRGLSIIVISHNLNDILDISDRIMVLKTGRLVGVRKKETTHKEEIVRMIILGEQAFSPENR